MSLPYISSGGSWMPMALPSDFDILLTPSRPSRIGVVSDHLRFLAVGALQVAAHQQIESLVGAAEFDVGFERDGVVALHQRVEQLVHGDRLLFLEAFVEVVALEHLRDGVLGRQADQVVGR